ncbi:hypothetical protein FWD20_03850 [Candidatus Saccharibacteria bacterium]|nr:hypothetical protein [Candidatus Saccharibacteria bacterium]
MKRHHPLVFNLIPLALFLVFFVAAIIVDPAIFDENGNATLSEPASTAAIVLFVIAMVCALPAAIYNIYWKVVTKKELLQQGASDIPTAWLLIVPIANIWWLWKYSQGSAKVLKERYNDAIVFILLFLLDFIGMAIIQSAYNKLSVSIKRSDKALS